ncbi:MAG: hypothetical protein KDJ65_26650 [Anaerolineae bacterium]|nr:hypothetical protein [Anaerolineae bacterium]
MVKIRISGNPADVSRAARLIGQVLKVYQTSDLHPNRRGVGVRVYVTADASDVSRAGSSAGLAQERKTLNP